MLFASTITECVMSGLVPLLRYRRDPVADRAGVDVPLNCHTEKEARVPQVHRVEPLLQLFDDRRHFVLVVSREKDIIDVHK